MSALAWTPGERFDFEVLLLLAFYARPPAAKKIVNLKDFSFLSTPYCILNTFMKYTLT